jgi:hypothetical protein
MNPEKKVMTLTKAEGALRSVRHGPGNGLLDSAATTRYRSANSDKVSSTSGLASRASSPKRVRRPSVTPGRSAMNIGTADSRGERGFDLLLALAEGMARVERRRLQVPAEP